MSHLAGLVFAEGFFQSQEVVNALLIGGIVAAISGVTGVFVVIRSQSFAGHAIADFGGAGAAGAFLVGINTLWGFLAFGILAAMGVEFLGDRARERDLATGVILAVALGVEALFLYFDTTFTGKTGAPMLILFGSIFVVARSTVAIVTVLTIATAVSLSVLYRPLLLCSIDPELAGTRGVPVRAVSLAFIVLLAIVVEEGSVIIGALLSIALLIGPAAAAVRLTHKIGWAMVWSAVLGMLAVWTGILLAYDSFWWPPDGRGWPVSFFICVMVLFFYVLARLRVNLPGQATMTPESAVRDV